MQAVGGSGAQTQVLVTGRHPSHHLIGEDLRTPMRPLAQPWALPALQGSS